MAEEAFLSPVNKEKDCLCKASWCKDCVRGEEICFMVRLYSKILGNAREMDDTSSRPQTGSRLHLTEVPHQTIQIGIWYENSCSMWYAEGYLVADCGWRCCVVSWLSAGAVFRNTWLPEATNDFHLISAEAEGCPGNETSAIKGGRNSSPALSESNEIILGNSGISRHRNLCNWYNLKQQSSGQLLTQVPRSAQTLLVPPLHRCHRSYTYFTAQARVAKEY